MFKAADDSVFLSAGDAHVCTSKSGPNQTVSHCFAAMTLLQKALKHSLMRTNYKLAYSKSDSAGN